MGFGVRDLQIRPQPSLSVAESNQTLVLDIPTCRSPRHAGTFCHGLLTVEAARHWGGHTASLGLRKPGQTGRRQLVGGGNLTNDPGQPPDAIDCGETQLVAAQSRWAGHGVRRGLLIAVVAGCACLMIVGVLVAVFSSNSRQTGHVTAGVSPALRQAQPAPRLSSAAPGLAGAGLAKSALRWPPGLKHRMVHWKAGRGGTALAAVTAHLSDAMQGAGVRRYAATKQACTGLASSVAIAQAGPPIPVAAMQRMYGKALAGLAVASANCRRAIQVRPEGEDGVDVHLDRPLLIPSLAALAAGSTRLYNATADVRVLRVR